MYIIHVYCAPTYTIHHTQVIPKYLKLYTCIPPIHSPLLTWRDMQYLIVYTSDTRGLVNGDWQTNGAGLKVSHKFGFGAINAEAMVTRAKRWTTVPPQVTRVVFPPSTS